MVFAMLCCASCVRKSKPVYSRYALRLGAIITLLEGEPEKELEATVAARRELGAEHEEHLIAGFLERIDKEIDRRVEERVRERTPHHSHVLQPQLLGPAAGIVAVAGIFGGPAGVFVALGALAFVIVVLSVSRR
jgi:hypothetical protein